MRVDSRELPFSAIPLCQLLPCHLGPPMPTLSLNLYVKGCLHHHWSVPHPYQWSLLSFRMRSRFSIPSHASSLLDLVVTMSCDLTLQIKFGYLNSRLHLTEHCETLKLTLVFFCVTKRVKEYNCWNCDKLEGKIFHTFKMYFYLLIVSTASRVANKVSSTVENMIKEK